jgi:hypothetical protein
VDRENLRDQRLRELLGRIYEAQEAVYKVYDLTLHAVYMTFEQALIVLPQIGRFLAPYKRLHILPEDEDQGDQFYDTLVGVLTAARTNDTQARDTFVPQVEQGAGAVVNYLISLATQVEEEQLQGPFTLLRKNQRCPVPVPPLSHHALGDHDPFNRRHRRSQRLACGVSVSAPCGLLPPRALPGALRRSGRGGGSPGARGSLHISRPTQ